MLYAFQNRRWDSDFLSLKRVLALDPSSPQSLGDLVEFESQCVSAKYPRFQLLTCSSYDRYRMEARNSWKDTSGRYVRQILRDAPLDLYILLGSTYDLGTHLIDQALTLFGRPDRITAFTPNVRGIGDPHVDDCVRDLILLTPFTFLPNVLTHE